MEFSKPYFIFKSWFDKKHSKCPPGKYPWQELNKFLQALFFSDPPLWKIWDWKLSPQQKGGLILWSSMQSIEYSNWNTYFKIIFTQFSEKCYFDNSLYEIFRISAELWRKPMSANKLSELISKCCHVNKYILSNYKSNN